MSIKPHSSKEAEVFTSLEIPESDTRYWIKALSFKYVNRAPYTKKTLLTIHSAPVLGRTGLALP